MASAREIIGLKWIAWKRKRFGYPRIMDVYGTWGSRAQRALFMYLVDPFVSSLRYDAFHQNRWRSRAIVHVLHEAGYCVDVVDSRDKDFRPDFGYDLFIGHGQNAANLASSLPLAKKMFFATGAEAAFNNAQEQARYDYLEQRKGVRLQPNRLAPVYTEKLSDFDVVVVHGNAFTRSTFDDANAKVIAINNHLPCDLDPVAKNLQTARNGFLFMASNGQVHKGLDIVLDAIAQRPKVHLYVCSRFKSEKDFCRIYSKDIFRSERVHPVGVVSIRSKRFREICRNCAFLINPSCAEGQAGSAIIAMHAGLIPIVSKETGLSVQAFGIEIERCAVEDVVNVIDYCTGLTLDDMQARIDATLTAAHREFSQECYLAQWKEIIAQVQI